MFQFLSGKYCWDKLTGFRVKVRAMFQSLIREVLLGPARPAEESGLRHVVSIPYQGSTAGTLEEDDDDDDEELLQSLIREVLLRHPQPVGLPFQGPDVSIPYQGSTAETLLSGGAVQHGLSSM
ncbi:hypothetical protein ACMT4L_13945 [Deinococcus sp. A31D244]|uniref:hypothetical protein n=1 Tax=Deinococcus sp. A31D244 TaxID=3397675 RepID=UPI0039DF7B9D